MRIIGGKLLTVEMETNMTCRATGIPQPTVQWYRGENPVGTSSNRGVYQSISDGSSILTINAVSKKSYVASTTV